MIKVEEIDVWGLEHAIRGMRNPLNSWDKSDSGDCLGGIKPTGWAVGENDLDLMRRLYRAGSEHRKYLRQIFISMDITAPLYWWKEFDTYKVGTTANSCSTMHTIHKKEFELDDFSHEHLFGIGECCLNMTFCDGKKQKKVFDSSPIGCLEIIVGVLNGCREKYLETKDKKWWWQMIQLLPSSYNQKRTITMNYENSVNMIHQRKAHKLTEWVEFVKILEELPYMKEITGGE